MSRCCGVDAAVFGHPNCAQAAELTPSPYIADWCPPACWRQHHIPIEDLIKHSQGAYEPAAAGA